MTAVSPSVPAIMDRLRESTADAHKRAETRPLMRRIARGIISREQYVTHLEQLLLVHRALEGSLLAAATRFPAWNGLTLAQRCRVPDLEADLAALGGSIAPVPLPETETAVDLIARSTPHELLGMFYVTEGSTNGGRFLVKQVAKGLALDPAGTHGLRAINPYGARQPERWAEFKLAMNALGIAPAEADELELGAHTMFNLLAAVAEGMVPEGE